MSLVDETASFPLKAPDERARIAVRWIVGVLMWAAAAGIGPVQAAPPVPDQCSEIAADVSGLQPADLLGSDGKPACLTESCLALRAIDAAIEHFTELIKAAQDNADKQQVQAALKALGQQRAELQAKVPKVVPNVGPLPEQGVTPWVKRLIAARQACSLIKASLEARMEAEIGLAEEAGKVAVCRDKQARLAGFLTRYFQLGTGNATVTIERARYGDIYNEDRDYRRQNKGRSHRRQSRHEPGAIDTRTPRAGLVFTTPEDREVDVDWDRHRHTCDVTWFFRKSCTPRPYTGDAATWAGPGHCFISLTGSEDLCGYDPSPQGNKQFHVKYTCNGITDEAKYPAGTKRINLLCEQPTADALVGEKAYFTSAPCAVTLPELPSAPAPREPAAQGGAETAPQPTKPGAKDPEKVAPGGKGRQSRLWLRGGRGEAPITERMTGSRHGAG